MLAESRLPAVELNIAKYRVLVFFLLAGFCGTTDNRSEDAGLGRPYAPHGHRKKTNTRYLAILNSTAGSRDSANTYVSLGEAFMAAGDTAQAGKTSKNPSRSIRKIRTRPPCSRNCALVLPVPRARARALCKEYDCRERPPPRLKYCFSTHCHGQGSTHLLETCESEIEPLESPPGRDQQFLWEEETRSSNGAGREFR